jgi:hypothetical protein
MLEAFEHTGKVVCGADPDNIIPDSHKTYYGI